MRVGQDKILAWIRSGEMRAINTATNLCGRPRWVVTDVALAELLKTLGKAGITRPFSGRIESWSYPVPDDTARAGAALRTLAMSRFEHRQRG